MKKQKTKLFMCISVLIIGFLLSTSSLNLVITEALLKEKHNQYKTDSFDLSTWKWNTTEVVSTESTSSSAYPSLAVDAVGNIHLAWYDWTDYAGAGTDSDIFYKRWDASTSTWTTTEVVSTESTSESVHPSLAVDATGNVHIAWQDETDYAGAGTDEDIFYKLWNASTSTWTTTEVVSIESTGHSGYLSLVTDAVGNIHITWTDSTDYAGAGTDSDIFYKRWDASTSTWTTTEVVSIESTDGSAYPSLVTDAVGNIHITWTDITDYAGAGTDEDIFYKRWDASTSTWTTIEVVSTESTNDSYDSSLAVDAAGNIHITWTDYTDYAGAGTDSDIFYKRWDDSTESWTTTEVIYTESTLWRYNPSLAVDATGNVHITWQDETDYAGSGIDLDIFYKRWEVSSSAWTTIEVVSTESANHSYVPSLAVDAAGNVHIAWFDITDYAGAGGTDSDIFYKFLVGSPAAPELAFIVPNPTELTIINLDWNNVIGAANYYIYRSTSYIWSVEGLNPITSVSSCDYIDTLASEGFYYYVVVSGNIAGNSSHSNCQYVEVKFPNLAAPILVPIYPNPTDDGTILVDWNDVLGASHYYIYRSSSYIWEADEYLLDAVISASMSEIYDGVASEGFYYYAVVAVNGSEKSAISNCVFVYYQPAVQTTPEETSIGVNMVGLVIIMGLVSTITIIRKSRKI